MIKLLSKWLSKEIKIWKWLLFTHIPTEKELCQRRRETLEKLGFVFFDEKKRDAFVKEIREYDFMEGLSDEEKEK